MFWKGSVRQEIDPINQKPIKPSQVEYDLEKDTHTKARYETCVRFWLANPKFQAVFTAGDLYSGKVPGFTVRCCQVSDSRATVRGRVLAEGSNR